MWKLLMKRNMQLYRIFNCRNWITWRNKVHVRLQKKNTRTSCKIYITQAHAQHMYAHRLAHIHHTHTCTQTSTHAKTYACTQTSKHVPHTYMHTYKYILSNQYTESTCQQKTAWLNFPIVSKYFVNYPIVYQANHLTMIRSINFGCS